MALTELSRDVRVPRRNVGSSHAADPVAHGDLIPGGIGGARSDGRFGIILDPAMTAAASERAHAAIRAARPGIGDHLPTGLLPAGVHDASMGQFELRFGRGERRGELLRETSGLIEAMHAVGVRDVVVGGSFVSTKPAPGDVDLLWFGADDIRPEVADAVSDWNARGGRGVHVFKADFVVTDARRYPVAVPGETFLEFFQHTRTGARAGAVLLRLAR